MFKLELNRVTKRYSGRGMRGGVVVGVDQVSLAIEQSQSVALVGESGSGKTTIARLVTRLEQPSDGVIRLNGQPLKDHPALPHLVQMIFQDPFSSLNPHYPVGYSLKRPAELLHKISHAEAMDRTAEVLTLVGLTPPENYLSKRAHQLSGGQRQRVNIARALIAKPQLIVADEPTSMLDVSVGLGILNLLLDLKERSQLAYLFITHNLAAARYVAERITVLYRGVIVEEGPSFDVINNPLHPYTRLLVESTPEGHKPLPNVPVADVQKATGHDAGCPFRARCRHRTAPCEEPVPLQETGNRLVRCVLYN